MGLTVVGVSLLGLVILLYGFNVLGEEDPTAFIYKLSMVNSYAMGASLFALFARAGGGIYTKGADMGADLVGKIEAGIPEDDPRNPAVIADNVGDNVGDVAGLGADLLESYVESIIASMVLIASIVSLQVTTFDVQHLSMVKSIVQVVLATAAGGIISSVLGVFYVKIVARKNPQGSLIGGTYVAAVLSIIFSIVIIWRMGVDFFWVTQGGIREF